MLRALKAKTNSILLATLLCCFIQSMGFATSRATADYVVYESDKGTISVASGLDGKVVASGEDASTIIQKAIDLLPSGGGKIYISSGTYMLTSTIRIEDKNGVHIEGAARGIAFGPGNEGTVLRSYQAIDMIEIFGNTLKIAGISISNLYIVGSATDNGKSGILVKGRSDLLSLHQVGVHYCGIGIYLKGGTIDAPQIQFCDPQKCGIGLKIESSHYSKIVGGEFSDNDEYGIHISSSFNTHQRVKGVKLSSITSIRNGKAAIFIGKSTDCITVTGGSDFGVTKQGSGLIISDEGTGERPRNIIVNGVHTYNNARAGIEIENADHVIVSSSICSVQENWSDKGQQIGIHIKKGSKDVVIYGNITDGNAKQGILDETGKAKVN